MVKINSVCIDLDCYTTAKKFKGLISKSEKRCKTFGQITHSKKTKHGWHIKVKLNKPVSFWRSIEIRYYCLDDTRRLFFDIMRYRSGSKIIDVCFDVKKTYKRKK